MSEILQAGSYKPSDELARLIASEALKEFDKWSLRQSARGDAQYRSTGAMNTIVEVDGKSYTVGISVTERAKSSFGLDSRTSNKLNTLVEKSPEQAEAFFEKQLAAIRAARGTK